MSEDFVPKKHLAATKGLLFKHFSINLNGSVAHIEESRVKNDSSVKCDDTEYVRKNYVADKGQTYLQLHDFDDHFADI